MIKEEFFKELLSELSYRSEEGYPILSKASHIDIICEILDEWDLTEIKNELIQNLLEAGEQTLDPKEKEKAKQMGLVWKGQGWGKEDEEGIQYKVEKGKLVPFESGESVDNGEPTKNSLKPGTEGGDSYIDSLPDGDPAKKVDKRKVSPKEKADSTYKSSEAKVKELYGDDMNQPLLQNSKTSNEALQKGYTKGKPWVAPGNAGSNFNENISNEAALIIERYPDISEEELASILFRKTKNTKLGKQQKSTTVQSPSKDNRGTIPSDIPTSERDLYRSCIIAARSGKAKSKRANDGKSAAQQQVGFGSNTTTQAYGGTETDLQNLSNEIKTANKIYVYDREIGEVTEIPKDVMEKWVAASGGGENAADTTVITKDENGNIIYDGWSDKKGFSDIQGNSTLNDDYSKQESNIDELQADGKVDAETSQNARFVIEKAKKESAEIEADYKKAPKKEAIYFKTYGDDDRNRLVRFLEEQGKGYDEAGTQNHVQNAMKKFGVNTYEELLDALIDEAQNGNPSTDRLKVINRLADVEREYIKSEGNEIPPGLDTKQILSDARERALKLQKETIDNLNEFKGKTNSGKEKPLGDLLGVKETIDFLHIDKINKPTNDGDFKQLLKRNTELIMAGVPVTPQNMKECLGVNDLNDYEDNFEVVTEEKIIKDAETKKYTTGKIVYIYAISKGGKRTYIGEKRYRSKDGATGKTSNTIQWSPDMQQCFDSK